MRKLLKQKKSPIYPLRLGGVWMVGIRGYIGLQNLKNGYAKNET